MSIKIAKNDFTRKMIVGDLGKLIVAKAFKTCPKSNKLPNLVTLIILFLNGCEAMQLPTE